MLEVVNNGYNKEGQDWHSVWKTSSEYRAVQAEINKIHAEIQHNQVAGDETSPEAEFAMPFSAQLQAVTYRVFQQYWRMPSYVFAKFILGVAAGLFIGFTYFNANGSQAGMQNVIFSVFMITTIFSTLVQQVLPPRVPLTFLRILT
jgi:hypothetical protein